MLHSDNCGRGALAGLAATAGAFAIWGISPLYWRLLGSVPAEQIAMHRILWSLVFFAPFLVVRSSRRELYCVLCSRRLLALMSVTSVLVAANWTIYIWAVTHDRVLEASLGYYINPLVNVALGMVFLGERLRPLQWVSVSLAAIGVALLTVRVGTVPVIALGLAGSFGLYALLRKRAAVNPRTGLTVEALLLTIPALPLLLVLDRIGQGAFRRQGPAVDLLLVGAGPVTAIPLLLFNVGAKRLRLATVGLAQYIAPTLMFLLAVCVFREPFSLWRLAVFALIWAGLTLYSVDAFRSRVAKVGAPVRS